MCYTRNFLRASGNSRTLVSLVCSLRTLVVLFCSLRTLVVLFLLAGVISSFPNKSYAASNALLLKQGHKGLGNSDVFVSNRGIHIHFNGSGGDIVSVGPKWDVILFNRREKVMYTIPFETWKAKGLATLPTPRPTPLTRKDVVSDSEWKGIDAYRVRRLVNQLESRSTWTSNYLERKTNGKRTKVCIDYLYLRGYKFPAPLQMVHTYLYDFPIGPGLPLTQEDVFGGNYKLHPLSTNSVTKIPESSVDLKVPSGFRTTKNQYEALYGGGKLNYFADWMHDMDIEESH